jgi:hypothetical protein
VDGFLNTTSGSAIVKLTHAMSLSGDNTFAPERDARVSIQAENGSVYDLVAEGEGTYSLTGIMVDPNTRYRLWIQTRSQSEYASNFVEIRDTPAIDSATWSAKDNGINILVNTHDDTGTSRYYSWEYTETWEYHAAISSDYMLVGNVPVYRTPKDRIYTCWRTQPSTKISIATTARLAEDVVHQFPITFLPVGSAMISARYSISVRQRVVTKSEFEFLTQLQRTTESLGGLFDPQPGQAPGNISSLNDPSSPALGYFSIGSVTEARMFVGFYDLPEALRKLTRPIGCTPDTLSLAELQYLNDSDLLGSAIYSGPFLVGYTLTSPRCADCRVQGGVLEKPSFWP